MNEKLGQWVEDNRRELVLALVGLALVGAGVFWWRTGAGEETKVEIISEGSESGELSRSSRVKVDVSGAVVNPGVYQLEAGARVEEALAAAGGLTSDANTDWIEKYLNMASRASDGQKIYVPRRGESTKTASLVNINTASQLELEGLPGVGPVTATKIISNRQYQNIEELLTKKIVGQKVWEQIKDMVSVW